MINKQCETRCFLNQSRSSVRIDESINFVGFKTDLKINFFNSNIKFNKKRGKSVCKGKGFFKEALTLGHEF